MDGKGKEEFGKFCHQKTKFANWMAREKKDFGKFCHQKSGVCDWMARGK